MKYINPHSVRGLVNKMADFILKKITDNTDYDALIEVTDCGKFFVINGMTNSKDILEMGNIRDSFVEEYKELLEQFNMTDINVIDLVIYDVEIEKKSEFWFDFYNTPRPSFHKSISDFVSTNDMSKILSIDYTDRITTEIDYTETNTSHLPHFTYPGLTTSSEFPYGYSLGLGRLHYYYSEYICNHIMNTIGASEISFKFSTFQDDEEDFDINVMSDSRFPNDVVKSLILDVFDFDLPSFKYLLSRYDLYEDIDKPFDEKPWLIKDRIEDIIII